MPSQINLANYNVYLEKVNQHYTCFFCGESLESGDVCLVVSVPNQTPLRFDSKECTTQFTTGVALAVTQWEQLKVLETFVQ